MNQYPILISIIIPVYNSEKFLIRCLNSIQSQTYKKYEVLLIDDGSHDKSPAICDAYSKKDPRFKVYHLPNGGPSKARNFGLENCEGGWILFVDSDDWLEPDALEIYKSAVEKGIPDIIKTGYEVDYPSGKYDIYSISEDKLVTKTDKMFITSEKTGYTGFLWDTLFCKKVIGNIRFDENLRWLEDHLFSYKVFGRCAKILFLSDVTYHYMADQGESLSNIKDAQMIFDAAQEEYNAKSKLTNGNTYANKLNVEAYKAKLALAIRILYRESSYSRKKRKHFKSCNTPIERIEHTDFYSIIFFSQIPFVITDILIKTLFKLKYILKYIKDGIYN